MITLPTPKTIEQARRQADVCARAEGMFSKQGYSAYYCGKNVWGVYGPAGQAYSVNLKAWTCTCPDYGKHCDYCKHLVGLQTRLDEEAQIEAQCAAYEAEEDARALMDAVATDETLRHTYGVAY